MWTQNFDMYKLNLEKAEEPEVKLPNPLDHRKNKRIPEKKTSISASFTMPSLWLCRLQQTVENSSRDGNICPNKNIFLGSKITANGDCSHEIKRRLLLGRKAMTNLDSILKSRHITLLTKVHTFKAIGFPIVMYGCESWTIKMAKHQRIDAFELWC